MSKGRGCGMVRFVDNLGRVVLPKEMRASCGVEVGSAVEFIPLGRNEGIAVKPRIEGCEVCGLAEEKELIVLNDRKICRSCLAAFNMEAAKNADPEITQDA